MSCGQPVRRCGGQPVLALPARNFGCNSVDLRVRLCAPQVFVYNSCVYLSTGFCEASSTPALRLAFRVLVRARLVVVLGPGWVWRRP